MKKIEENIEHSEEHEICNILKIICRNPFGNVLLNDKEMRNLTSNHSGQNAGNWSSFSSSSATSTASIAYKEKISKVFPRINNVFSL